MFFSNLKHNYTTEVIFQKANLEHNLQSTLLEQNSWNRCKSAPIMYFMP